MLSTSHWISSIALPCRIFDASGAGHRHSRDGRLSVFRRLSILRHIHLVALRFMAMNWHFLDDFMAFCRQFLAKYCNIPAIVGTLLAKTQV
ncbi:hypothetical protein EHS17_03220 [Rhodobacteraceae bacterium CH30]|nr:hypothetical protein EHS17_03220 [Rhodobacteraceae bacterium CH30]